MSNEYLHHLDSARTGHLVRGDIGAARRQAVDYLMLRLLSGARPVLAQTQAFDGAALLEALDADLLGLFRDGVIRVALHRPATPDSTLLDAFVAALQRPRFIFSAWPEIDAGTVRREQLLAAVESDDWHGLPDSTALRYRRLAQLSDACRQRRATTTPTPGAPSLPDRVLDAVRAYPDGAVAECLGVLAERGEQDRSVYYDTLDVAEHNGQVSREGLVNGRDLVDAQYGRVIAHSLPVRGNDVTAHSRHVAEHLAGLDERRRPVAGLAAVRPERVPSPHRPVDWGALRSVLERSEGDPDKRRALASEFLAEEEIGDGVRLVVLRRAAGLLGPVNVPPLGPLQSVALAAWAVKSAVQGALAVTTVDRAIRHHRLTATYLGLLEEDEQDETG